MSLLTAFRTVLRRPRRYTFPDDYELVGDEADLYRRWDTTGEQDDWDAMPLWMRAALCAECGWLDAVWEISPGVGERIDARRMARKR